MSEETNRALDGVELAIRRVSSRLKGRIPHNFGVTEMLDELADEIGKISEGSRASVGAPAK